MCLVTLAIDAHRRFPLVIAANRDEFFDRPAARLAWWTPEVGGPPILGGRDLQAGGTWLGLTAGGRLALVTNVRRPIEIDPDAPSRGGLVPLWLRTDQRADQYWMGAALGGYAPFNLIAADFRRGDCFWASNEATAPRRLERGVFGLSNAGLDTPWPKVETLKARAATAIDEADSVDTLAARLFEALADRQVPADASLPMTGIGLERERLLGPAFIRTEDGSYGTRCSTVIIAERANKRLVTHVFERTYTSGPGVALLRRARLSDWPPRYADRPPTRVEDAPVAEAELGAPRVQAEAAPPVKRTRVRSLLKPLGKGG
jgi:uncharacterized protein with NRDE domain